MKRSLFILAAALSLIVLMPFVSYAGTTPHRKNCPGQSVLIHWHNFKKGYVDVYWSTTLEFSATPQRDGTFAKGNHSVGTGLSNVYWGVGSRSEKSIDTAWVTCTSAV
jgi:hypothetical protein